MQTLKSPVQHITSEKDLLAWVIKRLEETEPFEPVTAELNQYCNDLIKSLIEGEPIVFAPITTASVGRALEFAADDQNTTTFRSIPLLDFLCSIGEILNDKYLHYFESPRFSIEIAIKAWASSPDFLILWECESDAVSVQSTTLCRLKFNVLINVRLEEIPWVSGIRCLKPGRKN